ncbi:hypothetical protein [Psychroserpens algicola]|uniref:Uncharacterized protein n=1 Tax=Psychroserpens algicola TaxID=1719034 RepID=A0ABT0H7Z6_9FLAO|nr:hypothetical protein [Psychroserpens algicola]MCK8480476.1 hypothetical protein [Psychroserpens algicola]
MSYIQHLKYIQETTTTDLRSLSKVDIIKIEKILKAQQQLNHDSKNTEIKPFIDSLYKEQKGLLFLLDNPNLIAILSNSASFKKVQKINYNPEDEIPIQLFFSTYLEQDLIGCCNLAFSEDQYGVVSELLHYRNFLPESVIHLIESKTETKLDYFLTIADKVVENPSILSDSFVALVKTLNIERLNSKKRQLMSTTTSYAFKALNRSGLSHFFYVMTTGLSWIGRDAETVEEKIEKSEVLKDFKFMSKILAVIGILFISVVIYKNVKDNERQQAKQTLEVDAFKKSIYGYLTHYDSTQINNLTPWKLNTSGQLNINYFKPSSKTNALTRQVMVVNNSDYELIIFPDSDLMSQFGLPLNSYYIKPNDSTQASLMFSRIYVGKQLALFKTASSDLELDKFYNTYYLRHLPRFSELLPSSETLIKKRFEFGKRIELSQRNDSLLLETNGRFRIDGASYNTFPL